MTLLDPVNIPTCLWCSVLFYTQAELFYVSIHKNVLISVHSRNIYPLRSTLTHSLYPPPFTHINTRTHQGDTAAEGVSEGVDVGNRLGRCSHPDRRARGAWWSPSALIQGRALPPGQQKGRRDNRTLKSATPDV